MRFAYLVIGLTSLLMFSACIFGNSDPEYYYDQYWKALGTTINEYYDNGCYIGKIYLQPREPSPDHFYFVESPEMLDSVFESISYHGQTTPRLDTLFPADGSLLIYSANFPRYLEDYGISVTDDTVFIDVTYTIPDRPPNPTIIPLVVPVGIVMSEDYYLFR